MVNPMTTMRVRVVTRDKLFALGNMGDTADSLLNEMIDYYLENKARTKK